MSETYVTNGARSLSSSAAESPRRRGKEEWVSSEPHASPGCERGGRAPVSEPAAGQHNAPLTMTSTEVLGLVSNESDSPPMLVSVPWPVPGQDSDLSGLGGEGLES